MREYTSADVVAKPDPATQMAHTVLRHLRERPDAVLFAKPDAGAWTPITARMFASDVNEVAKGLIAAGIEPGDRVGLMSATRYEWTLVDYAIWTAGAVTVPIYETSSPEQVRWILSDSGAKAVVLEAERHALVVDKVAADLPALTQRWTLDDGLAALRDAGRETSDDVLEERRNSRGLNDLATIVYTSGTTGRPKGCAVTHLNLWWIAVSAAKVLPEMMNEQGSTLLFLPLAHIFGRLVQGVCFESGVRVGHTADVTHLVEDLATFAPTFLLAVPRVFEKVHGTYRQTAHASGKGKIFDAAEKVAIAYSRALDTGGPGVALRVKHAAFEKILYGPKLRAPLGGNFTYAVSGGAPLSEHLGHFFRGIGITVCEGYGLTETSVGAVNTVPENRIGTVGRPSPGCTAGIREEDSEILLRGPNIFTGYWNDEASTDAAFDSEGWFHTGDIGELDDDGFLRITGRKKEVIVTAGGKNVVPGPIEERIRAHPLISQAVVIGDKERFVAALVTLDEEALARWAAAHDRPASQDTPAALRDDPALRAEVQHAIDDANAPISRAESVRAFVILPEDFTDAGGTLTPSLKIKRNVVLERYAAEIARIYAT